MKPFFETTRLDDVRALARDVGSLRSRSVELDEALGRTLAEPLRAPHDLPGFARSAMDGYAVRSRDTFGATEGSPAYLSLCGEVAMGRSPEFEVPASGCARIGTGGMLPPGADAVVMVEHTRRVDPVTVEVTRAAAPGAHVLGPSDDAREGATVIEAGRRLRPQDLGMMAALGVTEVQVVTRPRVGILSTGDEVVEVGHEVRPGQVRDVNAHTLSAQVRDAGAVPVVLGLVPDDEAALRAAVAGSIARCDLTLLSGGSSVGVRDLTRQVFLSFPDATLLVHGVSVAPGKPFLWVRTGRHDLMGLPGQVASCMVAFHLFVEPVIERLLGREPGSFTRFGRVEATLARNVAAAPGREVYQRVSVRREAGGWIAVPVLGKSGLMRTLVEAQGLVRIPMGSEGLEAGSVVTVMLFP